jgi:hypothetical protein
VLGRLANWWWSRPRRVAVFGGLLFALVGVIGGPAPGSFNASNAFDDPGSQATHARGRIERATGEAASTGVVALVRAPRSSAEVTRVARTISADPGIARVSLPPPSGRSAAVSRDGRLLRTVRDRCHELVARRLTRAYARCQYLGIRTGADGASVGLLAEMLTVKRGPG